MYETTDDSSVIVGVPDVMVKTYQDINDANNTSVAVAAPTPKPIKVRVLIPLTIKEGYLQVKEVGTEELITTI